MANSSTTSGPRPMYRSWNSARPEGASTRPESGAPPPRSRQRNPMDEYYRQQDEARRQAAELQKKQEQERVRRATSMDARNFPVLCASAPRPSAPVGFAEKAKEWAKEEEEAHLKERAQKAAAEHEKYMNGGVFIWRRRERMPEDESEEEEDTEQAPDEWSTIDRKTRKQRRERTVEEMDAYEEELHEEDKEFNSELLDNNKHDHR